MSLSITINNINDLTDTERAVLRMIVGDKQVTLTGPTATRSFIESLAGGEDDDGSLAGDFMHHNTAPAASIPTPTIPASAELDSDGLPWDKRIHSSSRNKLQDGTWRKLKGVDKDLVATVEAELRAVQAIPVPVTVAAAVTPVPVPPPASTAPFVPVTPSLEAQEAATHGQDHVVVPPAPTATLAEMQAKLDAVEPPAPVFNIELAPTIVPVVTPPAPLTFADLMKHVTPMLVGNKLSQDKLLAITAEFGLPHLAALGARPDLVEAVKARIDEVCNGAA